MKHILVVDDEPGMLRLLSRALSSMQYRVSAASGGPAALAAIGPEPIDLLVTDYRMPDMNGRELISAVRVRQPGLKALVVTGFPPNAQEEDLDWWHAQPHLTKPFSVRSLQDAVVGLIGLP